MGKVTLITGASRGIGYALALEMHMRGHHVIALARSEDKLQALKAECNDNRMECAVVDLGQPAQVDQFISALVDRGYTISHMINNAGALVNKPFGEISASELRHVYEVNVFSVFELIQKAMSVFADDIHVVNISSMGGFQGAQKFPGLSAYSSSKAAVASLTECLQEEFGEKGWSFNVLCLGAVQTEMLAEAFPGFKAPVNPSEMSTFIADFTEGAQKFIRGKVLPISSTTP
ncbi:SDR family NAD(P)-dependent oxidoreductase [Phaeocystidibacter marisrubri]|uniref:SDR family oxidoreductase n=1 Tax=Phaeocystidibacter marisrubri TaxID=1577780 RepID=A0A6L3ZGE6_9FLAO|nr:SDR family oxidoreductase [Phaeocystidibacter marisrubri]KAB2816981.1 SDR family oxidoreductase [Phaeocystidibacter marisrubri]GGH77347.1 short-chain dehydrogenase [Phaeocystidibacter marisrubri]